MLWLIKCSQPSATRIWMAWWWWWRWAAHIKLRRFIYQIFTKEFNLLNEIAFKAFSTSVEWRFLWIVVTAIIKYFCHVTNEFGQCSVTIVNDFFLNFLQIFKEKYKKKLNLNSFVFCCCNVTNTHTHRIFNDTIIVGCLIGINGFHEGPCTFVTLRSAINKSIIVIVIFPFAY